MTTKNINAIQEFAIYVRTLFLNTTSVFQRDVFDFINTSF